MPFPLRLIGYQEVNFAKTVQKGKWTVYLIVAAVCGSQFDGS